MNLWKKIVERQARRKIRTNIEPARDWLILCLFLLIILIIAGIGVGILRAIIAKSEMTAYARTSAQMQQLNQKQLDLILADHARREAELTQLQTARPAIVDPGI